MRNSEFLPTEPATADYVLSVLRDAYRHAERLDPEAEPDVELTFASTVHEWREACDLVDWQPLGHALNRWFCIALPDSKWRAALHPSRSHTLREVCDLVAMHARRPIGAGGASCEAGSTFIVLRTMLRQAGVPVADLTPSTSLESVARRHLSQLLMVAGRLAPGVIPTPRLQSDRRYDWALNLVFSSMLGLLVAALVQAPSLIVPSVGAFLSGVAGTWVFSGLPLRSVDFGSVLTFRDFVEATLAPASRAD